jgi:hypothetical protein
MDEEFAKPFIEIQKHIPKNQTNVFWIDCKDNSKNIITRNKSGEYILYKLKDRKITKIKQSQDCQKLQQEAEKEMKGLR